MSATKNGNFSSHGQIDLGERSHSSHATGQKMGQVLPLQVSLHEGLQVCSAPFDTFETDFFQQGEDSDGMAGMADRFEDLDEAGTTKRRRFSRTALLIAGASMLALGCAVLWRGRAHSSPPVASAAPTTVPVVAKLPDPQPVAPAEAVAVPAVAKLPDPPPVAPAEAVAVPAVAKLPDPPPVAPAAPAVREEPVAPPADQAKPALAPAAAEAKEDDAPSRCADAMRGKRNREILAICPAAVTEEPGSAAIAVTLARIEFDRGHAAQASAWSKKAIAANPESADAYVFLGGAEQSAGHGKAAKQAYQQYLRLAPAGRYAADLRAIVNSL